MGPVLRTLLAGGSRKSFSDLAEIAERPLSTTFAVSANYGLTISFLCELLNEPNCTVDDVIKWQFLKTHNIILVIIIPIDRN